MYQEFYLIEPIKHQEEYPLLPNTQIFLKKILTIDIVVQEEIYQLY